MLLGKEERTGIPYLVLSRVWFWSVRLSLSLTGKGWRCFTVAVAKGSVGGSGAALEECREVLVAIALAENDVGRCWQGRGGGRRRRSRQERDGPGSEEMDASGTTGPQPLLWPQPLYPCPLPPPPPPTPSLCPIPLACTPYPVPPPYYPPPQLLPCTSPLYPIPPTPLYQDGTAFRTRTMRTLHQYIPSHNIL